MLDDPKDRFTGKGENYARYRPSYPAEVIQLLSDEYQLTANAVIADVGSGTGILSAMFAANGNLVYGIEPNDEMRGYAEQQLADEANFISVAAAAESTTLPDDTAAFVTAGQAFHWFDTEKARAEFSRILQPEGYVVLLWNSVPRDDSAHFAALESFNRKYQIARSRTKGGKDLHISDFFDGEVRKHTIPNPHQMDWTTYQGRFLSSSWAPRPGSDLYRPALADLRQLFDQFQVSGTMIEPLVTELFVGQLPSR